MVNGFVLKTSIDSDKSKGGRAFHKSGLQRYIEIKMAGQIVLSSDVH